MTNGSTGAAGLPSGAERAVEKITIEKRPRALEAVWGVWAPWGRWS